MKKKDNDNGVPERRNSGKKVMTALAGMLVIAVSITAGYYTAPEDTRLPVLLADGSVILQPCYVAADGECLALVKNEETAEEVVARVKEEYKSAATTEVEIEEQTTIETLELKNGSQRPEILTAREASEQIVDDASLTVKTKEVVEIEEKVTYETIEKESDEMTPGEVCIEQEGENGLNRITKEVIRENGQIIEEIVLSTETVQECVPEIRKVGICDLVMPLDEMRMTSAFGYRWGRQHAGVDLGMASGSPVYAASAGTVTCAQYSGSYGNLVKIDHGGGVETYYAHCSRLDVQSGDCVTAGQVIAAVGSTGNSTGPHLHFEVRVNGNAQDPMEWLGKNSEDSVTE